MNLPGTAKIDSYRNILHAICDNELMNSTDENPANSGRECRWMCLILVGVKHKPGIVRCNLEKGLKRDECIVSGRNILSADEVGAGFHGVQSH